MIVVVLLTGNSSKSGKKSKSSKKSGDSFTNFDSLLDNNCEDIVEGVEDEETDVDIESSTEDDTPIYDEEDGHRMIRQRL